jgi:type IV secretory pathway VirB6-like protein
MKMALSAATGRGIDLPKFAQTVLNIMIVVAFVQYYHSPIPGMEYSLKTVISAGTADIAGNISDSSVQNLLTLVTSDTDHLQGPSMLLSIVSEPFKYAVFMLDYLLLNLLSAVVICVIAYGTIAATVCAMLGQLFIPFLLFKKLDFLFWGWFRAYLGFSFYQVVAACVLWIVSNLFTYTATIPGFQQAITDPASASNIGVVIILMLTCIYCVLKIPSITGALFSGHVGGGGGLEGAIASAATKAAGVAV